MKFNKSKKVFAHIDCDSFFAECEILKNPKLKNEYVIVGYEIVIACNYKTKALGIKTGTPVWKAKEILGNKGVYLEIDHKFYNYVSDKLMRYIEENTLSIEPFSIDEAFCEITGLAELNKMSIEDYVKFLQKDILKKVGVPVSIGVSNTRIKAKIFSKINKPFGVFVSLNPDRDKEVFKELPLSTVPFIGKKTQEKFKYSCNNIYDYLKIGFRQLRSKIGKNATDLRLELSGVNAYTVKKSKTIKSMSRGRSFNKNITNDKKYLKEQLLLNFNRLYEEFITKEIELKTVAVFLRDKSLYTHIFNLSLNDHTYIRSKILKAVEELFEQIYDKNNLYRSTGVIFSNFKSYIPHQTSIFDKPVKDKTNHLQLAKTINSINKKYGSHKLGFGDQLLGKDKLVKVVIRK